MEREIGMSPSGCDQGWPRSILALLLLFLLLAGGCSRIPKIIVLEDPLTAPEHVELGVAYERKGELDLAQREYERALRKDGKFYRARVNLGNIFLAKKEYGKAREEYLLALELRPGDAEATNNLSWAAIFSGEGIDEALARMESVVSGPVPPVFPTTGVPQQREARIGGGRQPIFLDTLGVLRMRANRPGEAEEAFALAESLCRQAGSAPREGVNGDAPCPEEVLREIEDHRRELRSRFP
jgi:tetratricopeptide (TPR) repeat protein